MTAKSPRARVVLAIASGMIVAAGMIAAWLVLVVVPERHEAALAEEQRAAEVWARSARRVQRPVLEGAAQDCNAFAIAHEAALALPAIAAPTEETAAIASGDVPPPMRAAIAAHGDLLDAYLAASRCSYAEIATAVELGTVDAPMPPFIGHLRLTKLALARARLEGADPCLETAVRTMRLGQDVAPGTAMVGAVVSTAIMRIGGRVAAACAQEASAPALRRAAADLRRLDEAAPSIVDALRTESTMAGASFRRMAGAPDIVTERLDVLDAWRFHLDEVDRWETARPLDDPARMRALIAIAAARGTSRNGLVATGAGGLEGYVETEAGGRAMLRVLAVGLDARAEALERGTAIGAPSSVASLDPFDGAPLRVRLRTGGSLRVWSIGADGIDGGGSGPGLGPGEDDIAIELR